MRIPNRAVAGAGAGSSRSWASPCLPLEGWTLADWAWRWTHLVVVLVVGMILNAVGLLGAGDAKFAAAAAPFVALADWRPLPVDPRWPPCWSAGSSTGSPWSRVGPRLAPDWVSWSSGKRFPMGVAFGTDARCLSGASPPRPEGRRSSCPIPP